jgi:acetyl esterase
MKRAWVTEFCCIGFGELMSALSDPAVEIQNPELIPLLREMNPQGGLAPFTVEEKRQAYRKAISRSGQPEPVADVTDRKLPGSAGQIPVRIYRPRLSESILPVVLYIHGGGFMSGDLDTHDPVCRSLAKHVPAIVVAVDYSLAPENPYPAAPEDCFSVLKWLAENAHSLDGDGSRIAVVGDSAGGNLAAALALMARDYGITSLAAQILIYPMLDATMSCKSLIKKAFIPPFTLVDCVYSWQLYLGGTIDRRQPYVSPLHADDLSGLAPALLITAQHDILHDEGEAYAGRLKKAGVKIEYEDFPDMIHGFFQWGGVVSAARLAMDRVARYLQHVFSHPVLRVPS